MGQRKTGRHLNVLTVVMSRRPQVRIDLPTLFTTTRKKFELMKLSTHTDTCVDHPVKRPLEVILMRSSSYFCLNIFFGFLLFLFYRLFHANKLKSAMT